MHVRVVAKALLHEFLTSGGNLSRQGHLLDHLRQRPVSRVGGRWQAAARGRGGSVRGRLPVQGLRREVLGPERDPAGAKRAGAVPGGGSRPGPRAPGMNGSLGAGSVACSSLLPSPGGCGWGPCPNGSEGALRLPTFSPAAQARVTLTFVLLVLAAAGNLAVLRAGAGGRRGRLSHVRLLLLHLAAADLLLSLVVMPLDAAWNLTLQWRAGDPACRLLMFLKLLAMYASAFVTVAISLDRQAAVLRPLAAAQAHRRNRRMLCVAWLLSAALSVPQLFLFHTVTVRAPQNFTQCTTQGSFPRPWHEAAYNMLSFAGLFLLPLLIMLCCYGRILLEISRRMGARRGSPREVPLRCSTSRMPRARLRVLRLSLAIVGSFVLCWTPYYLLGLWHWFCPRAMERAVPPALSHVLFLFGLLNACLDPLTYGLFSIPRARGCCTGGPGAGPDPCSPATGSSRCSATSAHARRGAPAAPETQSHPGSGASSIRSSCL
ncbi:gonadotropin-releasing hormone II receptor-like [Pelodiscus sinensis]|uniref:gonadotropin-releasing hormone II receptor-like n=1 Tax=Pelodiscus sinensis TaxID=13735 RepID=UPI003F6B14E8